MVPVWEILKVHPKSVMLTIQFHSDVIYVKEWSILGLQVQWKKGNGIIYIFREVETKGNYYMFEIGVWSF